METTDFEDAFRPRPRDAYCDDYGDVLWWVFPITEAPYCGCPTDLRWPDYHTHWTPFVVPDEPST